jgi:hypothetical protein
MKCSGIVACAFALMVSGSAVWAFSGPEPKSFDKAKFGTSIDDVRKAYPGMETADTKGVNHPKIQRFIVRKYKLSGLEKPTDIELQFWNGRFWLGLVHFGDNPPEKTDAYLRQHYGAPDYQDDNYMTWNGKTAAAVLSKRPKTFEVHDEGMSNEARAELFKGKMVQGSMQVKMTPATAARTPGAAPGGGAPASTNAATPAAPAK